VWNKRWLAWPLKPGWDNNGKRIGWAEFIALELAVLAIVSSRVRSATFTIFSDNKGVVGAFDSNYSRNREQNASLRRILCTLHDNNIWLKIIWVPSAENLADGPSRGIFPLPGSAFGFPPKIPYYLKPFVGNAVASSI
jgi:hypothetical protein